MYYVFRVLNPEDEHFVRDYCLTPCMSFLEFHHFLRRDLQLEGVGLASFFTTTEDYQPLMELTEMDMENDTDLPAIPMEQILVREVVNEVGQRLIYCFDILSERNLTLELTEKREAGSGTVSCIFAEGENPSASGDELATNRADIELLRMMIGAEDEDYEEDDELYDE
ncbi:MAG: hypothetical protein CSA97_00430 [Bacteroidetes bacterium]|nr:MAG: hypothetical protein CSA97_00430 [Bacteroidota bacterium]